jgi:hypothetical protein
MPIGEKAFEEKTKNEMPFIKLANTKDRTLLTYSSEVEGFGRWPSGTIIGSGEERIGADGKARSEWHGLWSTKEGEVIRWTGSDRTTGLGTTDKGLMLMHFHTNIERLQWMNQVIVMEEHPGAVQKFSGIGYEWK